MVKSDDAAEGADAPESAAAGKAGRPPKDQRRALKLAAKNERVSQKQAAKAQRPAKQAKAGKAAKEPA
jgi:hypothetical protein